MIQCNYIYITSYYMTIFMLLIEYRNVEDTEMKRWITSTLRYVFVLCFGERHRDMGNKEGESPQLKEVRGHIAAGGFHLLSSFWDKVSLDISATGMHMGASSLFFYICLPEPMWRWKFWGWDCRCESLYTTQHFCLDRGIKLKSLGGLCSKCFYSLHLMA